MAFDERSEKRKISKKILIGYFGSLSKREGVDLLLKHFYNLRRKDLNLLLIGGSKDEYREILKKNKLPENLQNVTYHENMNKKKAIESLRKCSFFVHLRRPLVGKYDSQGFPLKMLDYLNIGRPVIASNVSSYNFIHKNDFGKLINPYLFDEFKNSINELLISYDNYFGSKQNNYVVSNYTWKKSISKLNKIIKDV